MQQGPGRPAIPVEKQVLISLWYLGHKDQYYEISERFSVAAFNSVQSLGGSNELIK